MNQNESDSVPAQESIRCFLKVSIGGEILIDDIVIELNTKGRPKTCQSFLALCQRENSSLLRTTKESPQPTYRGCQFHRVVPGLCVQAGDWERFDGTGGKSPLWGHHWKDEELLDHNRHDREGIVSMANAGKPNTNGSQFFVTLKPTPHLDRKHVVFGRVVEGMESVRRMAQVERGEKDRPVSLQRIVIEDCGIVEEEDGHRRSKSKTKKGKKESKKKRKRKERHRHDDDSSGSSSYNKKRKSRDDRKRHRYDDNSSSSGDDDRKRRHSRKSRKKKRHRRSYDSGSSSEDRKRRITK